MNVKAVRKRVATVENMRERWIGMMKPVIARQLEPLKQFTHNLLDATPHPDTASAHLRQELDNSRQDWIDLLIHLYERVGTAFATHMVEDLAERIGVAMPSDHDHQAAVIDVAGDIIPDHVDRILDSLHTGITRRLDPTRVMANVKAKGAGDGVGHGTLLTDDTDDISDDDIWGEIQQLFDDAASQIAELETVEASNLGPMASAQAFSDAAGVDVVKIWQSLLDDHTREDHAAADGQARLLSEPFDVGDSQMMYPMDQSLGADIAQTIYCRCTFYLDAQVTKAMGALEDRQDLIVHLILSHKDWDEDAHPRDERGRFGDGGGSSTAVAEPPKEPAARASYVEKYIQSVGGTGSPKYDTDVLYEHSEPPGIYTPEREALHQQLVENYMQKYANIPNDRQALISGGLPGAGKTSSLTNPELKDAVGVDTSNYMPLNSDDFKEQLAQSGNFVQADSLSPMEHAAFLHNEASIVADMVQERALSEGKNVLLDITMNSQNSIDSRITELESRGYKVRGAFVDVDPTTAAQRAFERYSRGVLDYLQGKGLGGRYVPADIIKSKATPHGSKYSSRNRGYFENSKHKFNGGYVVLDNSGDMSAGYPRLIEASSGA